MKLDVKELTPKKIAAITLIVVMVTDSILFAAHKISATWFWIIAGATWAITYFYYTKKAEYPNL